MTRVLLAIALALPIASLADDKSLDLHAELLKQMKWRSIGPCNMGGRISDIAVDPTNPYCFYVGLATGGLIKTENNGISWTPLFDSQPVASIGAVACAIAPPEPDKPKADSKDEPAKKDEPKKDEPKKPKIVVWVGTGEANGRNSSSWGDGVYKSTDGGSSWANMGLKDSQEIGRILIDPKDSNTVFVAAAGRLWGSNKERGVFKTTDGGKTWQHVLAINNETGAIDLAMGEPGTLYAASYQRRRYPWGFEGIGPGAGIYKSTDSGKTWKKLSKGLPEGPLGRIGVSVSRSKPNIVYAVIESAQGGSKGIFDDRSKYGGVFRSDDSGESWRRVNSAVPRGFYFGQIRVDPGDPERVYVLGFELSVSEDGGKSFKSSSAKVHSDLHALWIDPVNSDRLLLGTDGGVYASFDKAKNWNQFDNFPMGEFYEVALDNREPYWVYGGLQDNSNWMGPSAVDASVGPMNSDWILLGGGDGFYAIPDPTDHDIVYFESQGGELVRLDRHTNRFQPMTPAPSEGIPAFRFNWNSPVAISAYNHDAVYLGGNRLFRFTNKGKDWQAISPDLSKRHPDRIISVGSGAETYGTIVSLAESPLTKGLIWAGTDDGNLQLTQDDGATWTDVTGHLPGKLRDYYVKRLVASSKEPGRAYVAIDGHRSDDFEPHLLVTEDYGKSWRSIVGDLPKHGPVRAIREDPSNPDLLFAGTEFGAWVSFDRGAKWHKLGSGLPTVAVDDIAIQPRDHALVAATHGRSFYVLDNIQPLEMALPDAKDWQVFLFPIPAAREFNPVDREWFAGSGPFRAANAPSGADIWYLLKNLADEAPKIEIKDSVGKVIADLTGDRYPGVNRARWDLKEKPKEGTSRLREPRFVKPGAYTVNITLGKTTVSRSLTITGPPELSEPRPGDEDEIKPQD